MRYDSRQAASRLKKELDRIRYTAYLMIALVVVVILVSVLRKFWLTTFFIAVTVFLQLFVFRRMQKNYVEHAVLENIKATAGRLLNTENVVIKGDKMLPEEVIRKAALVPAIEKAGAINCFAAVSGYAGTDEKRMEVTSCDVTFAQHQPGTKISADIVCGNWIHIRMPEKTGYWFTVSDGMIRNDREPDDRAPEAFPGHKGGIRLPERFYRRLEKLESYTTGSLSMKVGSDTADVFLRDRFLAGKFRAGSEVTEQMIEWDPLPELEKVLDLVWTLL